MSSNLEQEIQQKVQALSEVKQQQLLTVIEALLREERAAQPSGGRPIWAIFEELSQQVSLEEWRKLPKDGAEQHDHYLYGAPRRNNP
ncbi:MAG TPA: hypothetical protein VIS78_01075 [Blastocatellia bacterium]